MSGLLSFNGLDLDEPAQIGRGDQELQSLEEMNVLQEFQYEIWSKGSAFITEPFVFQFTRRDQFLNRLDQHEPAQVECVQSLREQTRFDSGYV